MRRTMADNQPTDELLLGTTVAAKMRKARNHEGSAPLFYLATSSGLNDRKDAPL
jgi:hypothetical protein